MNGTQHHKKTFSVPTTAKQSDRLCKIHHIVKGQCLRCPHVVKEIKKAEK